MSFAVDQFLLPMYVWASACQTTPPIWAEGPQPFFSSSTGSWSPPANGQVWKLTQKLLIKPYLIKRDSLSQTVCYLAGIEVLVVQPPDTGLDTGLVKNIKSIKSQPKKVCNAPNKKLSGPPLIHYKKLSWTFSCFCQVFLCF